MDGLDALLAEATAERTRKESNEQTPTKKPAPKPKPTALDLGPATQSSAAQQQLPAMAGHERAASLVERGQCRLACRRRMKTPALRVPKRFARLATL